MNTVHKGPLVNREQRRQIPDGDAIIIAKVSELSGPGLPLDALQKLYLTSTDGERKEMISTFRDEIEQFNTPKEKTDV